MNNKEKNFVSAVLYVHNAENSIRQFLKTILSTLEECFEYSEVICVNDASSDASIEMIKEISKTAEGVSVSVLHMSYFHGVELAMNAGVDLSIGDFVFEFDSTEMDFDASQIMRVYKKALEGYDIVSATPEKKQKISSKIFYYVFNKYANYAHKTNTERFRVLSRRVINRVSSMNKSIPYRKAVYANCGLKSTNLLYPVIAQTKNAVKGDRTEKKYRRNLAVDALILFTDVGYRFSIGMTLCMMLITIFMVCYSVMIYLTSNPVAGWTTTILFLSVVFFGLFGVLTIIIKYLQILIDLVFKRSRYSFEGVEKLTK